MAEAAKHVVSEALFGGIFIDILSPKSASDTTCSGVPEAGKHVVSKALFSEIFIDILPPKSASDTTCSGLPEVEAPPR